LTATRASSPSSDGGGLAVVSADQLPACSNCFFAESVGDIDRLRANGSMAVESSFAVQDLRLSVSGGPARRVRWDVLRLR
jgi:hypothetical protein